MIGETIIGYLFGLTADKTIELLKGSDLDHELENALKKWHKDLPKELHLAAATFDSVIFANVTDCTSDQAKDFAKLKNSFTFNKIPPKELWYKLLFSRWKYISNNFPPNDLVPFFKLDEKEASEYLNKLSVLLEEACEKPWQNKLQVIYEKIKEKTTESQNKNLLDESGIVDVNKDSEHWKIFPRSKLRIDDVYIEPVFEIVSITNDLEIKRNQFPNQSIIECCLDIITKQRFLYIIGQYGSGKTIITKKLHSVLNEKGWKCFFIKCSKIEQSMISTIRSKIKSLPDESQKYLIIFDSLEDIYSSDKNLSKIWNDLIFETANSILINDNVYFIFNTRLIENTFEKTCLALAEQYSVSNVYDFEFILLKPFTKSKQIDWLSSISNSYSRLGQEKNIYIKELKHQGLISACTNPLFLYQVADFFYTDESAVLDNIYFIYKVFVDKTVKGKFYDEIKSGSKSLGLLADKYRLFLRDTAHEIAKRKEIIYDKPDDENYITLDPNKRNYQISHEIVKNRALEFVEKEYGTLSDYDRNRLVINMCSCYFFEHISYNNHWKFKDNNILFFLIAEDIIETLKTILLSDVSTGEKLEKIKNDIFIYFHPFILDLIANRITNEEVSVIEELSAQLRDMISHNYIIPNLEDSGYHINETTMRIDALLCIIFMRINRDGYFDIPDFFNRLIWLADCTNKLVDKTIYNAIRRSFMKLGLYGINIFRGDLTGYNFSKSSIANKAYFNSCQFDDTIMAKCSFNQVTIIQSNIVDANLNEISGNINFIECMISKLSVKKCGQLNLTFSNSYIKNTEINFKDINNQSKITFENCYLDSVVVTGAHSIFITKSSKINDNCRFLTNEKTSAYIEEIADISD